MWSNRDCFTWFRFRLDNHSILFYVVFWQLLQCAFPRKAILIGVVRRKERRKAGKWCILCKCISFITFVYSLEWHRKTKEHLQWVLKNTKKRYGKTLSSLLHYISVYCISFSVLIQCLHYCIFVSKTLLNSFDRSIKIIQILSSHFHLSIPFCTHCCIPSVLGKHNTIFHLLCLLIPLSLYRIHSVLLEGILHS